MPEATYRWCVTRHTSQVTRYTSHAANFATSPRLPPILPQSRTLILHLVLLYSHAALTPPYSLPHPLSRVLSYLLRPCSSGLFVGLVGIVYFAAFLGFVVDGIRDMLLEMKSGKMYVACGPPGPVGGAGRGSNSLSTPVLLFTRTPALTQIPTC